MPGNRWIAHVRFIKSCRLVIIIWRFTDVTGKIFWTFKASYLVNTLGPFLEDDEFKIADPLVQGALSNFMAKRMRDPAGGPDAVKGRTVERNGRTITYEDLLPVNSFVLPDDVVALPVEDRWDFIEDKVRKMGNALVGILSSQPYLLTLKAVVSDSFYVMMTAPKNGPTYQAFFRDCTGIVKRMDNSNNFNSHVVLDDSKDLTELMFRHSISGFGDDDVNEGGSGNDDDDDDDDDDNSPTASEKAAVKEANNGEEAEENPEAEQNDEEDETIEHDE
jgi:hypothetical protein